jgi:Uri superfamily endonuclease
MNQIPSLPGSYVLHLFLQESIEMTVGRLGTHHFPAGHYFYLGSARGSGGLKARLKRHLDPVKNPFWHIDWFRQKAGVRDYYFGTGEKPWECVWGQILAARPEASIPAPGFGSSDCYRGCPAHLIYWQGDCDFEKIQSLLPITEKGVKDS